MKNFFKVIVITAIAASTVALSGCNTENGFRANDYISEVAEETTSSKIDEVTTSKVTTSTSETVTTGIETSTTNETTSKIEENVSSISSTETTSVPTEKPVESTSTKVETPVEKPIESTTSSTTKVEKPIEKPTETHTHNFSKATCEKPATCSCGATSGNPLGHNFTVANCVNPSTCKNCGITRGTTTAHNFVNGSCTVCGKSDPNYVAPHNCATDGHVWGNSYTEVETRSEEVIEYHGVAGSGYDSTLAMRYFGKVSDPTDYGIVGTSTSSQDMKTTNTVTTTNYFHKCTECGHVEMYDSTEEVIPSNVWERCSNENRGTFSSDTIWWDVNNIPADVVAASDREKAAIDEWLQTW